jgi:hypothetical protein
MMIPLPYGLGQLPGETGSVAVRHRMVVRTESLRIQNRHDTGSTSPRSVGEVALIWDTISHYSPVLIAPLAINFIAPAHPEKKSANSLRGIQRFFAHQQKSNGDRHMYTARTRFIPDSIVDRFEVCVWPEATTVAMAKSSNVQPVDIGARMRRMWR